MQTNQPEIFYLIPALNEEKAIARVIDDIPLSDKSKIIVVDNASEDNTAKEASKSGATVVFEPLRGYGAACLKGVDYISKVCLNPERTILVFIDGDYADDPREATKIIELLQKGFDLVIGSRTLGNVEKGALTIPQIFGNWLATGLLRIFYNIRYTDLGPFRGIWFSRLLELNMSDTNYGWTVEMQLKAAKQKFKVTETPVTYRKRIGFSKISGTVKGTILAGVKIIYTIIKYK